MVYNVLIGEGTYAEERPGKVDIEPSYSVKTISMSGANVQDSALTINVAGLDNHKLFGYTNLLYKAKFGHTNMQCDVICGFLPSTTGLSEYKLFRKPGTNLVFGAIYNAGFMIYPTSVPASWVDYTWDIYMIDYIAVSLDDLRFGQTSWSNAVVTNFGCEQGTITKTIRIGYKHENQISTGTYLIDIFIGESIDSTDYGIHYATVYENDVGTDNLFTYQVSTKQPYFIKYKFDESIPTRIKNVQTDLRHDINEIQNILGPFIGQIGSIRSHFVAR